MSDPNPLLQRPSWAPGWIPSIDDDRQVRLLQWFLTVIFVAGLTACVVEGADSPADPELGTVEGATSSPVTTGSSPLASHFGTVMVEIVTGAGEFLELCLLHADTPEERSRGLMQVTDLEGHDGMLFSNDAPVENQFVMINTVMPLSITWWRADGSLLSETRMTPCTEADPQACTRYPAGGPYLHAIEVPQGSLDAAGIDASSRLRVGPTGCTPT